MVIGWTFQRSGELLQLLSEEAAPDGSEMVWVWMKSWRWSGLRLGPSWLTEHSGWRGSVREYNVKHLKVFSHEVPLPTKMAGSQRGGGAKTSGRIPLNSVLKVLNRWTEWSLDSFMAPSLKLDHMESFFSCPLESCCISSLRSVMVLSALLEYYRISWRRGFWLVYRQSILEVTSLRQTRGIEWKSWLCSPLNSHPDTYHIKNNVTHTL